MSHPPSHPLTRRLRLLYALAVGTVALLALISQPLIQHYLAEQAIDSHLINVAGRQRMLSQKLAKAALANALADTPRKSTLARQELSFTADEWGGAQRSLQRRDPALSIPGVNSPPVRQIYAEIEPFHQTMLKAARVLASGVELPQATRQKQLGVILTSESQFLRGMNQIVFLYETEAHGKAETLGHLQILRLGAVLLVLALEALFVFRPVSYALDTTLEDFLQTQKHLSESESCLLRSEEHYRSLIESSSDCICRIGLDGRVQYMNIAGMAYNAVADVAQAVGRDCTANWLPQHRRLMENAIERAKSEGKTSNFEYAAVAPSEQIQQIQWWDTTVAPIREDGQVTAVLRVSRDITVRKQVEAALTQKEKLLRNFYKNAPMMMGIVEVHGIQLVHVSGNEATARFFARPLDEMENRSVSEQLGTPESVEQEWIVACNESLEQDAPANFCYERELPSGQRCVSATVSFLGLNTSGAVQFSYIANDITEQVRTSAALEGRVKRETLLGQITKEIRMSLEADRIYQTTADQVGRAFGADRCVIHAYIAGPKIRLPIVAEYLAGDTPSILDLEVPVEGNLYVELMLGQDRVLATPDVLTEPLLDGAAAVERTGVRAMLAIRTSYQGVPNGAIVLQWCGGVQTWSGEQIELLEAVADQVGIAIAQARLLEQEVQQRGLMSWQATHDPLTGLANRRSFEAQLGDAMREVSRDQAQHTLMYLDLDQFKIVNDTCGHAAGDELLKQVSTLLQSAIRQNDLLARLGGDEFGILLWECSDTDGLALAETLIEILRQFHFAWRGNSFTVGVSIGVAAIDAHSQDLASAMIAADTACGAAKDAGRNRVILWRADDRELRKRSDEMHWAPRLQQALEENRFRLYYQPIVATTTANAADARYEVLLRMVDEEGQIVLPMAFLPTAERYNLMGAIDRWVVSTLFSLLSSNSPTPLPQGCYFVNLSGAILSDERFVDFVSDQLRQHAVDPRQICFEITETVAIANLSLASRLIGQLKAFGCRFALDGFGSGTNSFKYLKSLSVDVIKIDGEFIRDLATDPLDRAIVESITRVAELLGLTTVAEFVENDAILSEVRALGIDFVQGYGIGYPEAIPRTPVLTGSLPQLMLPAGCE